MKDMSCRKKAVIWFYKLVTLFIVLVGWVLFRVENISDLLDVLGTMFSFKAGDLSLYVALVLFVISVLFLIASSYNPFIYFRF